MAKIFISHSSKDKELLDGFDKFLRLSFALGEKDVFYTSRHGALPSGTKFIETIKAEIDSCIAVIFVVSKNFLESPFCLTELGAAWALNHNIYPFLVSPVDHKATDKTPLIEDICRYINDEEALRDFGDDLRNNGLSSNSSNDFEKNLRVFLTEADDFITKQSAVFADDAVEENENICSPDSVIIEDQQAADSSAFVAHDSVEATSLIPEDKVVEVPSEDDNGFDDRDWINFYSSNRDNAQAYVSGLEAKANKGNVEAAFLSGLAYYDGILVEKDLSRAFDLIQSAAKKRYTASQLKLAGMYFWGETNFGEPNYELSHGWLEEAIFNNNPRAWLNFGWEFLNGLGCNRDLGKADWCFKRALEYGHKNSRRYLDEIQQIRERTADSLTYFVNAAYEGDVKAMLKAGQYYREGGMNFDSDYEKALQYYQMAVAAGSTEAEREIGLMYYYSKTPFSVGFRDAIQHLEIAAKAGDVQSEYYMGVMCRLGLGRTEDQAEAIKWFYLAAQKGHELSQLELGKLYARWENPDYDKAREAFESAAKQGSTEAMWHLGDLYRFGLGCGEDPAKAYRIYQQSAAQKDDVGFLHVMELHSA